MRTIRSTLVILLALALPSTALASGFQIDLHDAKGTGRGFAYTAGVDNAAAGYYNPASIALIGSSSISLSLTYLNGQVEYKPSIGQGLPAKTKRLQVAIPAAHINLDLSENVDVGMSMFNPFALATNWEEGWAGRYMALKNSLNFLFLSPSISIKTPIDGLSVGFGPQIVLTMKPPGEDAGLRLNRAIDQRFLGLPDGELIVEGNSRTLNLGYVVALTYVPPQLDGRVRFGVTWRATPDDHELEGQAEFARAQALGVPVKSDVKTDITLPPWLQVGVQLELVKDFLFFEVDYKWTDWTTVNHVKLDFADITAPDTLIDFDWEATNMVMAAVEVRPMDGMYLTMGYFYDEDPVPNHTMRPELPDAARHGVSFGAGFSMFGVNLNVSYMHLFFVTASKANLEGSTSPGGPAGANGEYDTVVDIVSGSLEIKF